MAKGTDLTVFSQYQLNVIAQELNERPRCSLNYDTPEEVLKRDIFKLPK